MKSAIIRAALIASCILAKLGLKRPRRSVRIRQYHGEREDYDGPSPSSFVTWLVTSGYAMAAATQSVHIGSYGRLEL